MVVARQPRVRALGLVEHVRTARGGEPPDRLTRGRRNRLGRQRCTSRRRRRVCPLVSGSAGVINSSGRSATNVGRGAIDGDGRHDRPVGIEREGVAVLGHHDVDVRGGRDLVPFGVVVEHQGVVLDIDPGIAERRETARRRCRCRRCAPPGSWLGGRAVPASATVVEGLGRRAAVVDRRRVAGSRCAAASESARSGLGRRSTPGVRRAAQPRQAIRSRPPVRRCTGSDPTVNGARSGRAPRHGAGRCTPSRPTARRHGRTADRPASSTGRARAGRGRTARRPSG